LESCRSRIHLAIQTVTSSSFIAAKISPPSIPAHQHERHAEQRIRNMEV
jgi:hypothetical protein